MIIHSSKVVFRDGKYYFKKGVEDTAELVTAQVLFFSESGALECDFNFKQGVFNGLQKLYKDVYYQLSSEENYLDGLLDGKSTFYREGNAYKESMYKDGNLITEHSTNK